MFPQGRNHRRTRSDPEDSKGQLLGSPPYSPTPGVRRVCAHPRGRCLYSPRCREGVFPETPDSPGPLGIGPVGPGPGRSGISLHRTGRMAMLRGLRGRNLERWAYHLFWGRRSLTSPAPNSAREVSPAPFFVRLGARGWARRGVKDNLLAPGRRTAEDLEHGLLEHVAHAVNRVAI
jgi:hypothetical protein